MSKQIGFVILSHNHPEQLLRLVRCLERTYDHPPIAIHHDFGQSSLVRGDFPPDVQFVSPHLKTGWGKFSLVAAALRALELLYRHATPDWFFLLSASDYPTMRADKVLADLRSDGVDVFLDYRRVPRLSEFHYTRTVRISRYSIDIGSLDTDRSCSEDHALKHFALTKNLELAWRRYIGLHVWVPIVREGPRPGRYMLNLPFEDWRAPFAPSFQCFYGDQWFTGSRKIADILLYPTEKHIQLRRHLSLRYVPDECYYQTVLVNTPGLKISTATRRFVDWSVSAGGPLGGSHPRTLGVDDLPEIIGSKSHFSRKFEAGSPVLDEMDRILL